MVHGGRPRGTPSAVRGLLGGPSFTSSGIASSVRRLRPLAAKLAAGRCTGRPDEFLEERVAGRAVCSRTAHGQAPPPNTEFSWPLGGVQPSRESAGLNKRLGS